MQQLRNYIALFFLSALIFISLPKELVHHCAADEKVVSVDNDAYFHAHCNVCNFHFYVAEALEINSSTQYFHFLFLSKKENITVDPIRPFLRIPNKAPPAYLA